MQGRRILRFWRDPATQDVLWATSLASSVQPRPDTLTLDVSCIFWSVARAPSSPQPPVAATVVVRVAPRSGNTRVCAC